MNFRMVFDNAWLLLLLIPAIFIVLWPYFRIEKKYRRTRNKVISLVLYLCIMILSIGVLAGTAFAYDKPNTQNEMMIVVDTSYSNKAELDTKNSFVKSIINSSEQSFKIGIVAFAKQPTLVADLNTDTDKLTREYDGFVNNILPTLDDSATDIAGALLFAEGKFTNPAAAKIVLISDGVETDGKAETAILSLIAKQIRVDTVKLAAEMDTDAQIMGIEFPNYNIKENESVKIGVSIKSNVTADITLTLTDGETQGQGQSFKIHENVEPDLFYIDHTFTSAGAHKISVKLDSPSDSNPNNNIFYSYIYLDVYDKILVLDRNSESDYLTALLSGNYESPMVAKDISDMEGVKLSELSVYDQIILMNIASADMPEGFEATLYSYVHDLGGGLLTIGGNEAGVSDAHSYNREDMAGTLYQEMLPVQCIDYTPPIAVMLVIDRSLSMEDIDTGGGGTKMAVAKAGAIACLDSLTERDYIGVISFSDSPKKELGLTPVPERAKIQNAINGIKAKGGTYFGQAINEAGMALRQIQNVEKKHIILITDGVPTDRAEESSGFGYNYYIRLAIDSGITLSVVSLPGSSPAIGDAMVAVKGAGGKVNDGRHYAIESTAELSHKLKTELELPAIKAYEPRRFTPRINHHTRVVAGIDQQDMPDLLGFYGVKAKENVEIPLMGEFTPIFAQWNLGRGRVGSFMSDLNGDSSSWSAEFIESTTGQKLIDNMIRALFPSEDISLSDIRPEFTDDNYTTTMHITTDMQTGDTISASIVNPDGTKTQLDVDLSEKLPKSIITFNQAGIYEIEIIKKLATGQEIVYTTTKAFSYSKEYDITLDFEAGGKLLAKISAKTGGNSITTPLEAVDDFIENNEVLIEIWLPSVIIVIIFFLLDIALRKFKFRWPWEILKAKKLAK